MEGHIVQGHIDGIGIIHTITPLKEGVDFWITAPVNLLRYIASKGSIAVDGVSLTVNDVSDNGFRLTIIGHTFLHTLFRDYRIGRRVNLESDVLARYLERLGFSDGWKPYDKMMALY